MKNLLIILFVIFVFVQRDFGQIDPNFPIMYNKTDSLPYHITPDTLSDYFTIVEIKEIKEIKIIKTEYQGKKINRTHRDVIPGNRKGLRMIRHKQVFFIRVKNGNTVYGIFSIQRKCKKGSCCQISLNQTYHLLIEPYEKTNTVPNEKIFYGFYFDGALFYISSQGFFIENIYTSPNINGNIYIEDPRKSNYFK